MRAVALLSLLAAFALPVPAQRNCTRGKPCGNTCIASHLTCRVGSGSATRATPSPQDSSRPSQAAPNRLLGQPTPAAPAPATFGARGSLSYCSTGLDSQREIWLVAGRRPSGTIGRDVDDGTSYYAPSRGDTLAAILVSLHCPTPEQVTPLIGVGSRRVLLDQLSVPVRSASGAEAWEGNILVRAGGRRMPAFVWVDALGTATLRGDAAP